MTYAVLGLASLVLVVYCVIDCITTPDDQVRNLPKLLWLVLILFFTVVGSLAWLFAGRSAQRGRPLGARGGGGAVGPSRPRRAAAGPPDDDEAFLRGLRERADEQRRRAERERRRDEGGSTPPTA